jgi:hypothetical protein
MAKQARLEACVSPDVHALLNLEGAVGRSSGCVPRGAKRGTTRRNSDSIPTSCQRLSAARGVPWRP